MAHGEQDGGKEPAAKPKVQLPEGRSGVHENDTHRGAEVALCQTPTDLAAIEAVALPAYRVQCRGERRDTGLGHTAQFLPEIRFRTKPG